MRQGNDILKVKGRSKEKEGGSGDDRGLALC